MKEELPSDPRHERCAESTIDRIAHPAAASLCTTRSSKRSALKKSLAAEIDALGRLSRSNLATRWKSIVGSDPPKTLGEGLLFRVLAYELQAKRLGGLRPSLRRTILLEASGTGRSSKRALASRSPRQGARLLRDWNGNTHVVDVTDDGYLWNGNTYRSLSAIAREITGARWSGPRFFGIE